MGGWFRWMGGCKGRKEDTRRRIRRRMSRNRLHNLSSVSFIQVSPFFCVVVVNARFWSGVQREASLQPLSFPSGEPRITNSCPPANLQTKLQMEQQQEQEESQQHQEKAAAVIRLA
jgi:hypothetical protein